MTRLEPFVLLVLLLALSVVSAYAQTPMDIPMLGLRTFFTSIFAPIAIIVVGIGACIAMGMFTSAPGGAIMALAIMTVITAVLASLANGTYLAFLGLA